MLLCFNIFYYYFFNIINKTAKIKIIFIFILAPLLFYFATYNFKYKNLYEQKNTEYNRILSLETSGRTDIWAYALKHYDYKKIFGYGPNGDRFFLKDFNKKEYYGDNSSNIIIYTLVSGGGVSLFFLGLILHKIFIIIKKYLNNKKKNFFKKLCF